MKKIPEEQSIYAYGNTPAAVNLYYILQEQPRRVRVHVTRILTKYGTILNKLMTGDSTERYIVVTMLREAIDELKSNPDEPKVISHASNVLKTQHKEWLRQRGVENDGRKNVARIQG